MKDPKFSDALHRLDTFPKVGHGKKAYVEANRIFAHPVATASIIAKAVQVLAHYKERVTNSHPPLTLAMMIIDPVKLVPTQNGIFRNKVEKDILKDRLSTPIVLWKYRDKFYILDGHHRAATALLVGSSMIQATVVYTDIKFKPAGVV